MNLLFGFPILCGLRIFGTTFIASFLIYAVHCIYNAGIATALIDPQPIIRHEVALDLHLWDHDTIKRYQL